MDFNHQNAYYHMKFTEPSFRFGCMKHNLFQLFMHKKNGKWNITAALFSKWKYRRLKAAGYVTFESFEKNRQWPVAQKDVLREKEVISSRHRKRCPRKEIY